VAFLLLMTSCKTVPGLEEPSFWICDIVNVDKAICYHVQDPTKETIEVPLVELLGYSCLNPQSFGDTDQHHEALHLRIEQLGGAR